MHTIQMYNINEFTPTNLPSKIFKTSPGYIDVSLVMSFCQIGVQDLHTHLSEHRYYV